MPLASSSYDGKRGEKLLYFPISKFVYDQYAFEEFSNRQQLLATESYRFLIYYASEYNKYKKR